MLDDISFAEFDRNPNFVLDDILPNVVMCLRSQGNYSFFRIDFVRDGIVDSLMEQ